MDSKLLLLHCNNMFNLQNQQIEESGKRRLIRYAGVIVFVFLIDYLISLIGVWLGENQRTNILNTIFKREWIHKDRVFV